MRGLIAGALALAVLAAADGDAAVKQTFCQKAVGSANGTVVWQKHGVTLFRTKLSGGGRQFSACSDAQRSVRIVYSGSSKANPARVAVAGKRCVAAVFTAPKKLPEISMKDLAEKNNLWYTATIGFDNPSAAVGSLAVSTNCAAAWGQSVTDGSGGTSYSIRAVGFSKATSLSRDTITEVANVQAAGDTKHVGIAAAAKRVKVKWTEAGVAKSATLP